MDDDTDMGYLQLNGDTETTAQMEQLGFLELMCAVQHVVSDVPSPPRITVELKKQKKRYQSFIPGSAFDLTVANPDDDWMP